MKVLVCITQAPDTTTKISFNADKTEFNTQGVTYIINPYDEWYALVRALELKEAGQAEAVDLVTVGDQSNEAIIRKALAIGGDKAYRIDADTKDPMAVAQQIAAFAKDKGYDLILTGKEAIDYNNASVGAAIAGALDYNYIGFASHLEIDGNKASIKREIEGGEAVDNVILPMVISCQKDMAKQRIPNMKGIMAARRKPLEVVPAASFNNATEIVSFEMPPAKSGVKLFEPGQEDQLIEALHNEAKVI